MVKLRQHVVRIRLTRQIRLAALLATSVLFLPLLAIASPSSRPDKKLFLRSGWALQSSCKFSADGAQISSVRFKTDGWHRAQVPTTVVAALVADKTLPDPDYGMNLRSYPGMTYPIGENFSNLPMSPDSPYSCSWWYRTEFRLPVQAGGKNTWLHFDGINYRANIWLNGRKIADARDIAGTFRTFEFPITKFVRPGTSNALAVEVFAPTENDLAITWVDWNPAPPDKDMGLWRDVYLTTSGDVTVRYPFVAAKLSANYDSADLSIRADLRNSSLHAVKGILRARIGTIQVTQGVVLAPSESKTVTLTAAQYTQLRIDHPRLWWPYQMGPPNLYVAKVWFESRGKISDSAEVRFGVRQVVSDRNERGARLFKINGRNLLIRGGGWSSDMLLRWKPERIRHEFEYVKDMGLNTIRLEGKLERDEFFGMADQMGILIMPGWCCCDMWEHWPKWKEEQYRIAAASLKDEIHRLRTHPSVFVWLYGSDNPPPPDVEQMYLKILADLQWPNPSISSASQKPTQGTGPSGVKMTGPYDYVPPNYWLTDKKLGGAYGFNTETSPGPAIPPLESLKRFLPADHLWPIDESWNYHAGGDRFTNLSVFNEAMDKRYGPPENLRDYLRKSDAMAYEGERAMFEAYARNKYASTGVIQWMLNNAWPSLIWHLYDYYLVPAGGYFGTKRATEMVHVQYSYDDDSVALINGYQHPLPRMKVSAELYDLTGKKRASRDRVVDLLADSSTRAFALPQLGDIGPVYFLRLELRDDSGKLVSENFYWLSRKPDVMDYAQTEGTAYTPEASFADLSALSSLPEVSLAVHTRTETRGPDETEHIAVENPSKNIAFMVRLRLTAGPGGEDVTPIFWEDNYFSLLPGEKREVSGKYEVAVLHGRNPRVEVSGWNVAARSAP
jgi:exo-1,4-beta-D-glucosaminidase